MQRDRFTPFAWGALTLCLGLIQWRAWSRAVGSDPQLADGTADMAWAVSQTSASFLLLAALALTAWWTGGGAAVGWRRTGDGRFLRLVALALAGTLVVGISGAVSALGDRSGVGGELEVLHPLAAVVMSLVLLRLVSAVRRRRKRPGGPPGGTAAAEAASRWANRLHLLVFAQLALGTLNTVVVDRVGIELVHLLLADLVWIATVLTCAASLPAE